MKTSYLTLFLLSLLIFSSASLSAAPRIAIYSYPSSVNAGSTANIAVEWKELPATGYIIRIGIENDRSTPPIQILEEITSFLPDETRTVSINIPKDTEKATGCDIYAEVIDPAVTGSVLCNDTEKGVLDIQSTYVAPTVSIKTYPASVDSGSAADIVAEWKGIPTTGYKIIAGIENQKNTPPVYIQEELTAFLSQEARTISIKIPPDTVNAPNCDIFIEVIDTTKPDTILCSNRKTAAININSPLYATPSVAIKSYPSIVNAGNTADITLEWVNVSSANYKLVVGIENETAAPPINMTQEITSFMSSETKTVNIPIPATTEKATGCDIYVIMEDKLKPGVVICSDIKKAVLDINSTYVRPSISIDKYPATVNAGSNADITITWKGIPTSGYKMAISIENIKNTPPVFITQEITGYSTSGSQVLSLNIPAKSEKATGCDIYAVVEDKTKPDTILCGDAKQGVLDINSTYVQPYIQITDYPVTVNAGSKAKLGLKWRGIPSTGYKIIIGIIKPAGSTSDNIIKELTLLGTPYEEKTATVYIDIPANTENATGCDIIAAIISATTGWADELSLDEKKGVLTINSTFIQSYIKIDTYPTKVNTSTPASITISWDKLPKDSQNTHKIVIGIEKDKDITSQDVTTFPDTGTGTYTIQLPNTMTAGAGYRFWAVVEDKATTTSICSYNTKDDVVLTDDVPLLLSNVYIIPSKINPNNTSNNFSVITADISEESDWTIMIKDSTSTTIRTYTGTGSNIEQLWDGKDTSGITVISGNYTCDIQAKDKSNNTANYTGTIEVSTTGISPTAPEIITPNGGELIGRTSKIKWVRSAFEGVEADEVIRYEIDYTEDGTVPSPYWKNITQGAYAGGDYCTYDWQIHLSDTIDTKNAKIRLRGYYNTVYTPYDISDNVFSIETTPPKNPKITIDEGATTNTSVINLTLYAEEADQMEIIETCTYGYTQQSATTGWLPYNTKYKLTLKNIDGVKTIQANYRDKMQNVSYATAQILLDLLPQAPNVYVDPNPFSPNSDGVNDTADFYLDSALPVAWTVTIKDTGTKTLYQAIETYYSYSFNAQWDGKDSTTGLVMPDGDYTYYIDTKDEENNSAPQQTGTITIKTKTLLGAGITIDEGDYTTSPYINLTLTCSTASEMQTSEDNTFTSAKWEEYQKNINFALSAGDGIKTVYARYRSAEGNQSNIVSDAIILDATPPTAPTINPVTTPTNNPLQTITGTKSIDTTKIEITGAFELKSLTYPTTSTWDAQVELQEGFNEIYVYAIDSLGNQSDTVSATIYYSWNIDRPGIEILSPHDNEITNTQIITGRVSDPAANVTVNTQPATVNKDGTFAINLTALKQGENTITAVATDKETDTAEDSIKITYDTIPPVVTITQPVSGATLTKSPIKATGTITEPNLNTIYANNAPAVVTGTTYTADGIYLYDGANTITVTAQDKAKNKSTISVNVTLSGTAENYRLEEVTGSTYTLDETSIPEAGTQHEIRVRLLKNEQPAEGEDIKFTVTQGKGKLSSGLVYTDSLGEAGTYITLDKKAEEINVITAYPVNCPTEKTEIPVMGKPGTAGNITRLTDETLTYVPGAEIVLLIKVTDKNNNPVKDEQVYFTVTQGSATLDTATATTLETGEAYALCTLDTKPGLNKIRADLASNPSIQTTFALNTISLPAGITVTDIINKVNANDQKIQDITADITVTSTAIWADPLVTLKIWQKGDKQKVQELSPKPRTLIRPPLQTSPFNVDLQRDIIAYNQLQNTYIISSKVLGQKEVFPYEIYYVDYGKGVLTRTEYYLKEADILTKHVAEMSNFIQLKGAWIAQMEKETMYTIAGTAIHTTTNTYSNIQINTGLSDSLFK